MTVDPRAASGFAHDAAGYERGRPSYPPAAVEAAMRGLGIGPASTVVDLGAGTGKLTRRLVPRVARVVAVEPLPEMRAQLAAALPGVEVIEGTAEALPLPDGSADGVFVAEAFHWFRTREACAEIARVLRPGGGLALFWNTTRKDGSEPAWWHELDALVLPGWTPQRFPGGEPGEKGAWKPALEATGLFGPLSRVEVDHEHVLDPDGLVALIGSYSWIANLPPAERHEVLGRVRTLAAGEREIRVPYRAEAWWARRADDQAGSRGTISKRP